MTDLSSLEGKNFAVVLYTKGKTGEDEGSVFFGKARVDGETLNLDRGKDTQPFKIPKDTLGRLQRVNEDIKEILCDAEYWIWLTVADIPEGDDIAKYQPTHLKWPTQ